MRRYLVLEEETDTAWCPDWYQLFAAARYLRVAPWELAERPIWYKQKALIAMSAENGAQKIKADHQK